jgi:predicted nucleic acid-binding protein
MQQGTVVPLNASLAVAAAKIGHGLKLPLADSVILATARTLGATLGTQDSHFEGLKGVKFHSKGLP